MNVTSGRRLARACIISVMLNVFGDSTASAQETFPAQEQTVGESSAQDKSPDHRLVFLGDRGPHRPQVRANALIPVMRQRGIAIEYIEDPNILGSPRLAEFDGLMLYANIDEITPEQEAGLLAFVEGGNGFVPLHCASFCFRNSEKFVDLVAHNFDGMRPKFFPRGSHRRTSQSSRASTASKAGTKHTFITATTSATGSCSNIAIKVRSPAGARASRGRGSASRETAESFIRPGGMTFARGITPGSRTSWNVAFAGHAAEILAWFQHSRGRSQIQNRNRNQKRGKRRSDLSHRAW